MALPRQGLLSRRQAKWNRRHASQSDANVFNHSMFHAAQCSDAYFGDSLRIPRSDLAGVAKYPENRRGIHKVWISSSGARSVFL